MRSRSVFPDPLIRPGPPLDVSGSSQETFRRPWQARKDAPETFHRRRSVRNDDPEPVFRRPKPYSVVSAVSVTGFACGRARISSSS